MTRPVSKVARLVRLNKFREDQAGSAVRRAVVEQAQAREAHALAEAIVDAIGEWKTAHLVATPDLGLYSAVLGIEARAVARADDEQGVLATRTAHADTRRGALHAARSATRASERRHDRQATAAATDAEKREFDRTSEAWLAHHEEKDR